MSRIVLGVAALQAGVQIAAELPLRVLPALRALREARAKRESCSRSLTSFGTMIRCS
jgi:hypothetical protein